MEQTFDVTYRLYYFDLFVKIKLWHSSRREIKSRYLILDIDECNNCQMISQFGNISKRIIPKICAQVTFEENETGVAVTVSRGNVSHSLTAVWDSGGLRPTLSWEQLIF